LLRRIDARGSAEQKVGSGRPSSARTSVNISKVEDLICSQADVDYNGAHIEHLFK